MKKEAIITILLVFLVVLCTIAGTYSIIIDVTDKEGTLEMVEEIKLRDIFTETNGEYNDLYFDAKRELNITDEEANILMNSIYINDSLQIVLKSIVDYKSNNNNAKLSNDEIYNLIKESVTKTTGISDYTKTRIINKSLTYKNDISKYLYDIEINVIDK